MPLSTIADPLLVVILGPTASGKSSLAHGLAQQFNGEIVSCDSVAVYRYFEIGTAKPSLEDRRAIPHHLIDVSEPSKPFTAGEYSRQARAVVAAITSRGRLPIVVGGTGLYLRALLEGLFPGPERSETLREQLRERVKQKGPQYVHKILARLDPASAEQIHANDTPKTIRAIEVCMAARSPMSDLLQQRGRDPLRGYRILRLGLDPRRDRLYERINQRAEKMFEQGLIDETSALLKRFPHLADTIPFNALGYRQAVQYLRGELTHEKAVELTKQGHRNYAKRQMTWFRREPHVMWIEEFGDDYFVREDAFAAVEKSLAGG